MWRDTATGLSASSETLWEPYLWLVRCAPLTGEPVARVGLDHLLLEAGGRDVLQVGRGVTVETADRSAMGPHPVSSVQAVLATSCWQPREMPHFKACLAQHHATSQTARSA